MKRLFPFFRYLLLVGALAGGSMLTAQVPTLRVAFHIFQTDSGTGNFHADSAREMIFLQDLEQWINTKVGKLDTHTPPVSSPYVPDAGFRIRVDTVFFHRDSHAWDCSVDIDAPYMRKGYVDQDSSLSYRQKHQTLPVFIGGNISIVGGHSRNIGDKGYIGMRGFYQQYIQNQYDVAVEESAKNLLHEIGHTVGLMHNFRGGSGGDQCDTCEDNGCPDIGTSNNIMDYWPSYGHALSECQTAIIRTHLKGERGNISDVLVNDSCYRISGFIERIGEGDRVVITDTVYLHGDLEIMSGGELVVTGYLSVADGCLIRVSEGGRVRIEGGTIGNLCGDLWEGIVVSAIDSVGGVPVRIRNGGVIENARVGLNYEGIAVLDGGDAVFRNNVIGVLVGRSELAAALIRWSHFRTTRLLNRHEEGVYPEVFIRSLEREELSVENCSFVNESGTFLFGPDSCGIGIDFSGRQMSMTACSLENLTVGLRASADQFLHSGYNQHINNRCGIQVLGGSFQAIRENRFLLQRLNDVPTFGVVIKRPGSFDLSHNFFESAYGSGQMAGIYLEDPGLENSYIGSNKFKNLPAAVLVRNPPDIEHTLLEWAGEAGRDISGLKLGPILRKNQFDRIPVRLMLMEDSLTGTMFGSPENVRLTDRIRADQWPVGGYWWYEDSCRLTAAGPADMTSMSAERKHGFYTWMNMWDPATDSISGNDIDSLKKVLMRMGEMDNRPEEFFSADLFSNLRILKDSPMALRSARISANLHKLTPDEPAWYLQALAGIAGTFTRNDSTLISLGSRLTTNPTPSTSSTPSAQSLLLPSWPSVTYYRFLPPSDFSKPHPAFDIRPNPASEFILVYPRASFTPNETWRYEIFSAEGQVMKAGSFPGWQSLKIETSGLAGGIYFIRIFGSRMNLGIQRFIIIPA